MSLLQTDAWGKGVVRNALASGPLRAADDVDARRALRRRRPRVAARDQRAQRRAAVVGAAYGLPPLKM